MTTVSGNLEGLSKCCLSGTLHEGTPKGHIEKLADVDTYVTGTNKAKTILFLTDIFGFELPNARLLADEYAETGGYRVVMPNIIHGAPVPIDLLKAIAPQKSDAEPSVTEKAAQTARLGVNFPPFLTRNREGVVLPLVKKIAKELKNDPEVQKLGVVGFCWGARYAIILSHDDPEDPQAPYADAVVGNHPSFVEVPKEIQAVRRPLWINVGSADSMMPPDQVETIREVFVKELKDVPCRAHMFKDAVHGFAVRADLNNEHEKAQKDEAARLTVDWFNEHLK